MSDLKKDLETLMNMPVGDPRQGLDPIPFNWLKGVDSYVEWKRGTGFMEDLYARFPYAYSEIVRAVRGMDLYTMDQMRDYAYTFHRTRMMASSPVYEKMVESGPTPKATEGEFEKQYHDLLQAVNNAGFEAVTNSAGYVFILKK